MRPIAHDLRRAGVKPASIRRLCRWLGLTVTHLNDQDALRWLEIHLQS
jgi:hypothetical protein